MIKKQPFIIFCPKNKGSTTTSMNLLLRSCTLSFLKVFVKSMMSCLLKLKVTPSFCFNFKIPDNPTATKLIYKYIRYSPGKVFH